MYERTRFDLDDTPICGLHPDTTVYVLSDEPPEDCPWPYAEGLRIPVFLTRSYAEEFARGQQLTVHERPVYAVAEEAEVMSGYGPFFYLKVCVQVGTHV